MARWGAVGALLLVVVAGCAPRRVAEPAPNLAVPSVRASYAAEQLQAWVQADTEADRLPTGTRLDTVMASGPRGLSVYFSDALAHQPMREDTVAALYDRVRTALGPLLADADLELYALGVPVASLVPNYYRPRVEAYDTSRLPRPVMPSAPVVRRLDGPPAPSEGLAGRHLALWPSHGWYYEASLDRWEWQRARVFETVEDLLPMAFVTPYLAPMLERAGANVFLPRERDVQKHEVVLDADDAPPAAAYREEGPWRDSGAPGFAVGTPPYAESENPFEQGTTRVVASRASPTASVAWVPEVPEAGDYAVYVSYGMSPEHVDDAQYTVHHAGGTTRFAVNQQMGGGTWIYLGTFRFEAGRNPEQGRVVLTNASATPGRRVSADAVRFGGGMGSVARNGRTSGRPRFVEAARYYLQYAGMPGRLVYNITEELDDYRDDYQGRGEWVNYLRGAPYGPNKDRGAPGLGLPIDLSLAFHTDAGVTRNDTVVGTLMIYSSDGAAGTRQFPDSTSRFASRDLADILQTQIVTDLRAQLDPAWTRRSIWDRDYSEAFRPNVPAALLELLSHQNYRDMTFALDPRFRRDASRAIYKGILRFLATQHGLPYTVQPLPISHLRAQFTGPASVRLDWQPVEDPLEPTAVADRYVVYTRIGEGGFDNGFVVDEPSVTFSGLLPGVVYSYRVAALNAGGASAPSEVVAVGRPARPAPALLVLNAFDRIAPPATLEADSLLGFASFWDHGVPDGYDLHYVGAQYNFDATDPWEDDDDPGHGASYGTHETTVIPGNTFDFAAVHGRSILAAGYGFVTASDEAVMDGLVPLAAYPVIDVLLGEEKRTPWPKPIRPPAFEAFPDPLQARLQAYAEQGGRLFVSGAYVGSDLVEGRPDDHPSVVFARDVLGITHRTNHAARIGRVHSAEAAFWPRTDTLAFNTRRAGPVYAVEAPDAIEPADDLGTTIFRYTENNLSAGVRFVGPVHRTVVLGFPFETIPSADARDALMQRVLGTLLP